MKRYPLGLACAVIVAGGVPALASGASLRPGDLDVAFSGHGMQTTDFGGPDAATAVAVQADGKIVVAGSSGGNFTLARHGTDGTPDASFSGDGLVTTDLGGVDAAQGVAIQADGKIVVAGSSGANFALARYTAAGVLDTSFSGDGVQTTDFGATDGGTAVAIQADGRILVGGSSGGDFALARYDAGGGLDTSFSGDGKQTTDFGGLDSSNDVAVGADGAIVAVGTHAFGDLRAANFAVARYSAGGALVGVQTTDFGHSQSTYDSGEGVAIQPDGRIVVVGYGQEQDQFGGYYPRDLQLARYDAGGTLDTAFSDDGRLATSFGADTFGYAVALEGNGRIVAFGRAAGALTFARLNTDGTFDATFSDDGKQTIDAALAGTNEVSVDGVLQADGKLVAVGTTTGAGGGTDFVLARLHGDVPDPDPPGPNTPETQITGGQSGPTNVTAPSYTFTSTLTGSTFECKLDGPDAATGTYASCASPKAYGPLTDGRYTFSVRATRSGITDPTPATRPFTVDTIAPGLIYDAVPPPYTNNPFARLEFHSTEPNSTFQCRLDMSEIPSFDVGPCVSPRTYGPLYGVAMWNVFVFVTDAAGNETGYWTSGNWTVDQSPPSVAILSGPSGTVQATTASFEFNANEEGTFECKLDGPGSTTGAYTSCSAPKTYSGLAGGAYAFSVRAIDLAGNGSSPETRSFRVDPTPTSTPSPTPSPSPTGCAASNGTDVPISDFYTVDSPIAISDCAGSASATAAVEVHVQHTYIADLVVSLIAPDGSSYLLHNQAGGSTDNIDRTYTVNLSSEPANGTWRLRVQDTAAADVGRIDTWSISLAAGPTPTPSPTPTATATSTPSPTPTPTPSPTPGPTSCSATNGADVPIPDLTTVESPITVSGCPGNASATATVEAHIQHTYIGDLVVSLIAPDGSTYPLHTRAGGSTDNLDQTYTVNLAPEPANGTWKLRVQDAAAADIGRIDTWTINLGAGPSPTPTATPTSTPTPTSPVPDTTITVGPNGPTNETAPVFAFTATVANSTFACKLDTPAGAGSYAPCTSPRTYTTTTNGAYTFSVRATSAGGTDATPASRLLTIDTVAPETSLDSGPVGSTTDDTPRFTFSSNEPGSFECRLDTVETPGFFEPCSSPLVLGPLGNGIEYAVFVRAIDSAGNPDPTWASSGLFVVDGSPPDTWIDDGPTGVTSVTTPVFTFHATLAGSTFECKLDTPAGSGAYTACTSPRQYTTTVNGLYTLTVRATSNGRTDQTPATQSFTVASSCAATNGADVPIPDLTTVESPITVSGCPGNASATATVEAHIQHTYIGDLVVSLIAPDGSTYPLHTRAGGSTDNLDQTYTVNLAPEPANGTWKLRVQDAAAADIGRIDTWTINL